MRKLIVLAALLALVGCKNESYITKEGKLVIDGNIITAFQVDGSRCIMATDNNGHAIALSCDHTYALRQGEERIKP
jgi:hypothetical protein